MSQNFELHSLRSEKILPCHQEKLAVVYVRQSTLQQVLDHQESTKLQYGLVNRAIALGWSQERVLVIDDDLGKSGISAQGREGFQRLVAEVGMNHVGLILGIEMSRLARSSKDWHQLLEICALFRTLIADLDGVYDPSNYNDRLLLGLKGTMSEAELHIIKQRMVQGKLNKAQRGELNFLLPTGYVRRPSGEVAFDPDEQVQQVIRLIFRKFEELGTLNAVLRYLVKNDIKIGIRVPTGLNKGDLEWHRPHRMTLQNLLKNPLYAGAYAYGRRQIDPRKQQAGQPSTGRVVIAPDNWHVLLPDCYPAYISWEQYQWNLARLKSNQARAEELGAVRHGPSILSGLLVCGRCGCRMAVQYSQAHHHRYVCCQQAVDYGEKRCQQLAGAALDKFVSQQVLLALTPAALELSLEAATYIEQERLELDQLWQQRLERATFEAERAGRHYRLVEPENRLVARQLATEWEEKLAVQQSLREDYQRFCHQQPHLLSNTEREAICQLAQDIPALWVAATTTNSQRKEIIRQVIAKVIVEVIGDSEQVQIIIEWVGGTCTEHSIVRPVAKLTQLSQYDKLCERLKSLITEGLTSEEIAQRLNSEGYHPAKCRDTFNRQGVLELKRHLGLCLKRSCSDNPDVLKEAEWWLPDLARTIGMPNITLYNWVKRGWVKARQQEQPPRHWIIWADAAEVERLRQRRLLPLGYATRQKWLD
ncbi:recombinase family protein [Westiellopsis prolifica IICB1]|nr:recombinase family protein [Westiellopsis prolifica IICB1]